MYAKPLSALALILSVLPAFAAPSGYWTDRPGSDSDYEHHIRIAGDTGFYCVSDGKSSFRFRVIGESITTPMNGLNALVWYPASGDIEISGKEKGETYSTRYRALAAKDYPARCLEEEAAQVKGDGPLAMRRSVARHPGTVHRANRDWLGRIPFPLR